MTEKPKKKRRWLLIVVLIIGLVMCVCVALQLGRTGDAAKAPAVAVMATRAPTEAPTTRVVTWVTMDGIAKDGFTGELFLGVPIINVWRNYENRAAGVVCRVKHGERVQMVERSGDGVLIVCPDGTEGWVTFWFIRELKWLEDW